MALFIPAGHGVTPEEMVETGGFVSAKGWGHFVLDDQAEKDRNVELHFTCVAHEAPQNVDKRYTERLYFIGNADTNQKELWKRILYWAWKLDLVSEGEVASGEAMEIDFQQAVDAGAQCVIFLKEEPYTDKNGVAKTSIKADYKGIFKVDDPIVGDKSVPLDEDTLVAGGLSAPERTGNQKANGKAPAKPPAAQTKPSGGKPPAKPPVKTATADVDDLGDV
jgi:hypothetical protein